MTESRPLSALPLARDDRPTALVDGLWLVLLIAIVLAAVVAYRKRSTSKVRQPATGTSTPWNDWLSRMTRQGDGSLAVEQTVRLGPRGELHVVRWNGETLLIASGTGGVPTLIARHPAADVKAGDSA